MEATECLVQETSKRGVLLIYISTDYVFPGRPGEAPYAADAKPDPPNLYGQTKLDGENAVITATAANGLGLVLRVPVLYGDAAKPEESAVNVLMKAVWEAQEAKGIRMDDWAQRYPTNTEDVARVCMDIAIKYLDTANAVALPKILQFSSEDRLTKFGMCQLFADVLGLPLIGMEAQSGAPDPTASVQRPFDTHLSTQTLKDLGIKVHTQDFSAWW